MEDLLIYGAGALAVRGARRMFFGPSREARLAEQVQQLSTQVAQQARMIQQLQTQALASHSQRTSVSPAQHPGDDASRSGMHHDHGNVAVAPRGQGACKGKRLGSPAWRVSRDAKRARHAAPMQAAAAGGYVSDSSEIDSEIPSNGSPSQQSLPSLPPGEDEASRSEECSSSESEEASASERKLSRDAPGSRSQSSERNSEDVGSSDSEEEELPPLPQVSMPSSDEATSDSQSSSEDDSASEATSSDSDDSSSSESEGSLPAQSDPAVRETPSQSPDSQPRDPASRAPRGSPEGPAVSASRSASPAASERSRRASEDYGSSVCSQDAAPENLAEGASIQQPDPDSDVCHDVEEEEQLAERCEDVSRDLPGPSLSDQRSRSAGDSPQQHCSSSEGGLSADEASPPDPEAASGAHEAPCGTHTSSPRASPLHSSHADDSPEEQPVSHPEQPQVPLTGPATSEQAADVAQASHTGQEAVASSSQHAASRAKRGRGAAEDAAAQPEAKRRSSVFQRCSEALSGWLFPSTPGTACSASAACAAPTLIVPDNQENYPEPPESDAPEDQEQLPETGAAEEALQPPHALVSAGSQAEWNHWAYQGGQKAADAAHDVEEANLERIVSEEPAIGAAAPEAQHALEPIATGVFAEEAWSTDNAFVTELECLLDNHVRLRGVDPFPPFPVQDGVPAAQSPTLHEEGLQDPLAQEPHGHPQTAGTGDAAGSLGAPQEPFDLPEAGHSPTLPAETPPGHSLGAAALAGQDTGLGNTAQPASPHADGAEEGGNESLSRHEEAAGGAEGRSEGHAAQDTPTRSPSPERPAAAADKEGQHGALHERVHGRGVSASPGQCGASLHASLRLYSARSGVSPSPPWGGYSPQYLSPPSLSPEPLSPLRHDDETRSAGCTPPGYPSHRHDGISPAYNHGALVFQPGRMLETNNSARRPAYNSSPHSDRRRSLQSRSPSPSPSPSPRWHSPSPARRGRRSLERRRSASGSQSPRRGRSCAPDSSGRRSSPDTPSNTTPSWVMRYGWSRSATPYERSRTLEHGDRGALHCRSSPVARTMPPDMPEVSDKYEQALSRMRAGHRQWPGRHQDSRSPFLSSRSPTHSAQDEELSPVSDGTPTRSTSGRRAQRSPSPARDHHSPAERSESRSPIPSFTPARSYPGAPAWFDSGPQYMPARSYPSSPAGFSPGPSHQGGYWSPTDRPMQSPSRLRNPYASLAPPELYPHPEHYPYPPELSYEAWDQGSPRDGDDEGLSAGSPPGDSPAQVYAPLNIREEADHSPLGRSAGSVSAELGTEQQARSPSTDCSPPVRPSSREISPPARRQRWMGDRSPSPAYPSSRSPSPSRGRREARSNHSPATSDSSSEARCCASGRRSADSRQSPAVARPTTPETPTTKGLFAAERGSATPDASDERPRSPLMFRSPTPAPHPGPSADFWRNHQASARASSGSLPVDQDQPDSAAFPVGAQPHGSWASEDDLASEDGCDSPASNAPSALREAAAKPGGSDSPPHAAADVPHSENATPTAPSQPGGGPASPGQLQGRIRWPRTGLGRIGWAHTGLARGQEACQGSFSSKGMLPNLFQARMRYLWPRAAQGPSSAADHDGVAGEHPGEDAEVPCGPAWQQNVSRPRRADSHSRGSQGVRVGLAQIERSPSLAAPHAQGSHEPEHSLSSGGRRRNSGRAVSHGRNASGCMTSHGGSGSPRRRSSGGSQAVSHGQPEASLTTSHGHSGHHSGHRRRRCGRGRRALGAMMRKHHRFTGGWRHGRAPWGSRSHGRSSSAISAALASADQGVDAAAQPAASQEAPTPLRAADASPQLRAPPGRARGVLLPCSASLSPEAEAPMWDEAVWQKSDAAWQRAGALQEQHMQRMAAREREALRAAAEAENAAAQEQHAQTARDQQREAYARGDHDAVIAALDAQMAATRRKMEARATACHAADAAWSKAYQAVFGAGSRTAWPTQAYNMPQTEGLIDLTMSDSD